MQSKEGAQLDQTQELPMKMGSTLPLDQHMMSPVKVQNEEKTHTLIFVKVFRNDREAKELKVVAPMLLPDDLTIDQMRQAIDR